KYVLWDRAGDCADNAYGQTLMGATPQAVLCTAGDSIAGPRTSCTDASLRPLFDTMLANLDKADLGLGAGHKVEQVRFLPKSGTPVAFKEFVSESFSNIATPREVVVKDAAAWATLWAEHSKTQSAPQFDFTRNMLVAVFSGGGNAGCRSYGVVYVGSHNGKLVVEVEDHDVSPVALCPAVVTQPMRVVSVPRLDAPVEVRKIVTDYINFRSVEPLLRTQVKTERDVVVRDEAAWASLWAEHAGKDVALPKVDFSKEMVIGVFRGAQPDGCRSTWIETLGFENGKLKIGYVDTVPGKDIACTMAIVYPAHLVIAARSEAPVEFNQNIRTIQ
ncbi:MAG: hypothetical protein ACREWI_12445, partial [Telluria sp.]